MKLYFVRHGSASHDAPNDEERPLTEGGNASMQKLGVALAKMGVKPKRIYTSPRLRAKQTAQHIGDAIGVKPRIEAACDFDFDAAAVAKLVKGLSDDSEVMFVGHNPSMSEVVEALCGAQVDLPVGSVVSINRISPPITASAVLKWLITPDILDSLTDSS